MIQHSAVTAALFALCFYSYVQPTNWVQNVWAFLTWITLFAYLVGLTDTVTKEIIKTHKQGQHAPAWFDFFTYTPVIVCCAAFGEYGKAIIWLLMATGDANHRRQFEQRQKAKSKFQNN